MMDQLQFRKIGFSPELCRTEHLAASLITLMVREWKIDFEHTADEVRRQIARINANPAQMELFKSNL